MRFVWYREHTRAGQSHARTDARGGDPVEQHKGDEPWAALMIPHCGGDTQRDNRFITRVDTAKHTKGAKRTMSAYTPCALRFYTLVLRLTAVTLTHVSEETRHSHEEGREESALAQVLFNTPPLRRDLRARSQAQSLIDRRESTTREPGTYAAVQLG